MKLKMVHYARRQKRRKITIKTLKEFTGGCFEPCWCEIWRKISCKEPTWAWTSSRFSSLVVRAGEKEKDVRIQSIQSQREMNESRSVSWTLQSSQQCTNHNEKVWAVCSEKFHACEVSSLCVACHLINQNLGRSLREKNGREMNGNCKCLIMEKNGNIIN